MQVIIYGRLLIAKIVNATVISLAEAPQGFKDFDSGVARKFVIMTD
jgi:glutathione-independent formaldehyde dehydrogenase